MSIYRGAGGAGDATNDATSQAILAAQSAVDAAASEAAAASSASSAATSATNAASSATSAASSATSADNSASSAATQAANAASSAATATTKAAEAATSATNAASSATSAATSATNASNSATAAANSATSASNSASAASTSATNSANSASAAATSATNSAASETNAAASANSASNSATSAAASATSAGNSASTATTQASNAASSASVAATSASNAATSATNASNSATSAATSATNAANSASSASTSATSAANSATAAAASYDSFDDRYLGSKTSNPTLDNDGNALLTGALYWNSTVGEMRVYNGSTWVAAYVPAATYVAKAGDVMTGNLEVPTQASLKATALTRASIRPSLLLDFANTKQLDPRITFSRPTTATYYDGKTVVKAEENLLIRSQEFDNASWSKFNLTVTANSVIAPDGTTTAETLTANTATNGHNVSQSSSLVGGSTYTISVYAKKNTVDYVSLAIINSSSSLTFAGAAFNLSTGVVSATNANGTGFSVTATSIFDLGGGWYRCVLTAVHGTSGSSPLAVIAINDNGAIPNGESGGRVFTGNGTESVYIWGAQLEQRSAVTAYTPTTTAPITNYIPALQTAAAGVARFEHNPTTGESLGLLIEEQRTNLLTYSEQFDNAAWTKLNSSITSNTIVAPDGTLTGDMLFEDTTNNQHFTRHSFSATTGTTYTLSVFAKINNRFLVLNFTPNATFGGSGAGAYFNLATGVVGNTFGTVTTSITPVGNGWYRCVISAAATATGSANASIGLSASGTTSTYTGDGYSGIYIWGAQLEAGAFPTSYIPTVASQVTRSADSASMTGSNFSSWYRADEGSLLWIGSVNGLNSGTQYFWQLDNGTTNNRLYSRKEAGASVFRVFGSSNGTSDVSINPASGTTIAAGTTYLVSTCYKLNDFAASVSGQAVGTDTAGNVAVNVNALRIGSPESGTGGFVNGCIKRIAYYPKRLSNTELQGLTS